MRAGAAPEAREVRAALGPARPPTTSLRSDTTQCCSCSDTVMRHRKWSFGSGEALERGGRLHCHHDLPFVHLRTASQSGPAHPHCFRMLNARTSAPNALSQLSIYNTAGFGARTNTPLPTIAIMHAITAELHTEQGHLFSGDTGTLTMACPRNNARVLNLSIGGVARAQNSPSSSQLSNTGIHPSLKIPLLPPFLKDLSCSRNSLTCAGGAGPIFIHTILYYTYNYTTLPILDQDTGAP